MNKRVFIGVGHGGSDPGASKNGIIEKNVNLDIALAMKSELEKYGVVVGISRVKDENDDIGEEIREANAFKPNIAIDVHTNAGGGKGFEVLVQTNKFAQYSNQLASLIEKEVKAIGQLSRGIKTRKNSDGTDYFGFLRQVQCPSIITECAFVDGDSDKIDTLDERKYFGKAYARGVLKYLGIPINGEAQSQAKPQSSKNLIVNDKGNIFSIDVDTKLIDGKTYVQLRDLEKINGIKIDYDSVKKQPIIIIEK